MTLPEHILADPVIAPLIADPVPAPVPAPQQADESPYDHMSPEQMAKRGFYHPIKDPCRIGIAYPQAAYDERTVIVMGCGRGGTTAIAGIVDHLGIRMVEPKERSHKVNMEDGEIVRFAIGKNLNPSQPRWPETYREISKVIERRNAAYTNWGWKDPAADLYLEAVIQHVRNPLVLLVFRNIFDVGLSNVAAGEVSFEMVIDQSIQRYLRCWQIAAKLGLPTLFVSYERAILKRQRCVEMVADFLRLTPSCQQIEAAVHSLRPGGGYVLLETQAEPPPEPLPEERSTEHAEPTNHAEHVEPT